MTDSGDKFDGELVNAVLKAWMPEMAGRAWNVAQMTRHPEERVAVLVALAHCMLVGAVAVIEKGSGGTVSRNQAYETVMGLLQKAMAKR